MSSSSETGRGKALWLVAAASLLLGACSTLDKLNPFSSTPAKVKPAELGAFTPSAEVVTRWQANVGAGGEFVFTPAVVGDSVYAAALDGSLARFDQGRQVWRISTGKRLSGGVGSDGKLVAVATPKGEVLVFDAQAGQVAWTATVSSEVLAAPAVGDGMVVVRSGDARLFAFDAANGKRRWVYQRTTPALSLRSHVGVVLADRAVLAGFPGGKLVAVAANNGVPLWEVAVAQPKGSTELERIADLASLPLLDSRQVCAVAFQGRVSCFDIANGNQLWSRDISSIAGIAADARAVYVSDDKGTVHALDRGSGASLWKQDKLSLRRLSRPLVVGSYIAVGDYQGVVHLLRRDDGAFAARFNTDGGSIVADPQPGTTAADFIVQTSNGGVYGLSAR